MCGHDGYSVQTYYTLGRTFSQVLSVSITVSNWYFCNRHGQYLGANPVLLPDKGNLKTSRPDFFILIQIINPFDNTINTSYKLQQISGAENQSGRNSFSPYANRLQQTTFASGTGLLGPLALSVNCTIIFTCHTHYKENCTKNNPQIEIQCKLQFQRQGYQLPILIPFFYIHLNFKFALYQEFGGVYNVNRILPSNTSIENSVKWTKSK